MTPVNGLNFARGRHSGSAQAEPALVPDRAKHADPGSTPRSVRDDDGGRSNETGRAHADGAPPFGHGRDSAGRSFGAVLGDVAQGKAAKQGGAATATGTRAAPVAPPRDVSLGQLALRAADAGPKAAAGSPKASGRADETDETPSSEDASDDSGGRGDPNAVPASATAVTLLVQTATRIAFPTDTAGATMPPSPGDAKALVVKAENDPSAAATHDDDALLAPTQVTSVEIANHPSPVAPAPTAATRVGADARSAVTDKHESETEAGAPVTASAKAAPPGPDADARDRSTSVVPPAALMATSDASVGAQPLRQITDAVKILASEGQSPVPGSAAQGVASRPSPSRSLVLRLAPESLGAITVRLHLAGQGGLSVRLAVENQATLGLVTHSRDTLQAAIGAAYKLDSLVIHGADAAPQPQAGSQGTTHESKHDTTRSDGGTAADPRSGGQRGDDGAASQRPARQAPRQARPDGARRADGLFV